MSLEENIEQEALSGKWSHAYLIIGGSEATQKEAVSLFAEKKGCLSEDITIIQSEDESGKKGEIKVAEIRGFLHDITLTPHGKCRLGVIYGAEKLNQSSANMLLKTIEEPPKNVAIFLTSKTEAILATIRSRCRIYRLKNDEHEYSGSVPLSDDAVLHDSLRDIFKLIEDAAKNGQSEQFISELKNICRRKMLAGNDGKVAALVEEIELSEKQIKGNANPRLALEAIVIKMRRMFHE